MKHKKKITVWIYKSSYEEIPVKGNLFQRIKTAIKVIVQKKISIYSEPEWKKL